MADKEWDLIVIGAGPAGLFASITASYAGARTLVLEKMPRPGLKLLASGSGRCNITHAGPIGDFLGHYGHAGRFLKPALYGFDNDDLKTWLAGKSLSLRDDGKGKLFPSSGRAADVLEALVAAAKSQGVHIRTARPPTSLHRRMEEGEDGFVVVAGDRFSSRSIILATGGRSYPATGSSGDGYLLAADCGHRIIETAPALAPFIVAGARTAKLAGISLAGTRLILVRQGRVIHESSGDLLFTHTGLSGPLVLDASRSARPGDIARVSLLPGMDRTKLDATLRGAGADAGRRRIGNVLHELGIAERLVLFLLDTCIIDEARKAGELRREERLRILDNCLGMEFPIAALGDWNEAMVTRGGVDLGEIDPRTMMSNIVRGLFFAGEIMDIDGDTGGYNLQAAFSTGFAAGKGAAALSGKAMGFMLSSDEQRASTQDGH